MKNKRTLLQKCGALLAVWAVCAGVLLSCSPAPDGLAYRESSVLSSGGFSSSAAPDVSGFYKSVDVAASAAPPSSSGADGIRYYFPRAGQKAQPVLIGIIGAAKQTLDVAIYSFTDQDVASALIKAKNRGVAVRVITDKTQSESSSQKTVLKMLTRAGIPVKVDTHSGIMHLKMTVADGKTATTGSFNYTKAAENSNDEVFVAISSEKVAKDFGDEFDRMWNDSGKFKKYS